MAREILIALLVLSYFSSPSTGAGNYNYNYTDLAGGPYNYDFNYTDLATPPPTECQQFVLDLMMSCVNFSSPDVNSTACCSPIRSAINSENKQCMCTSVSDGMRQTNQTSAQDFIQRCNYDVTKECGISSQGFFLLPAFPLVLAAIATCISMFQFA